MRRHRLAWGLTLIAAWSQAGCGPRFEAVKAAATVGEKLAGYDATFASLGGDCRIMARVAEADPKRCDALTQGVATWEQTAGLLAAYASALSQLAGKGDASVKDAVASIVAGTNALHWTSLESSGTGAVQDLAQQVAGLMTHDFKAEKLAETIKLADPRIDAIVAKLDEALDAEIDNLTVLDKAIERNASRLDAELVRAQQKSTGAADPSAASDALQALRPVAEAVRLQAAYFHFHWIPEQQAALRNVRKTAEAFRQGHHKLFEKLGDLDKPEMLATVVATVRAVYGDVQKLTTTKP